MTKKILFLSILCFSIIQNLNCSDNAPQVTPLSQLQAIKFAYTVMRDYAQRCADHFDHSVFNSMQVHPLCPSSVHSIPLAVAFAGHAVLRAQSQADAFKEPVHQTTAEVVHNHENTSQHSLTVAPTIEQQTNSADTVGVAVTSNQVPEEEWRWNWYHTVATIPGGIILWAVGNLLSSNR